MFDCSYEVSRKRLEAVGRPPDRFEAEDRAFFERVRASYAGLAREDPSRVRLIDGAAAIEQIRDELQRHIAVP